MERSTIKKMIEKHPFGVFAPKNARYLFLGSFPGQPPIEWFFVTKRNQFWPIMTEVYQRDLTTTEQKQRLFEDLCLAITDTILSTTRKKESNLDVNLTNIVPNIKAINKILDDNKIQKIFFSSRFAEKLYRKHFKFAIEKYPKIELITLPSPSPRYAVLTKGEKIKIYKRLLPKL
jgi:hypoxanthine-DNA glycosylase